MPSPPNTCASSTRAARRPEPRAVAAAIHLERLIDRTVLELHPTLGSCWLFTGPASPYGRIKKGPELSERYTHRLGWMILRSPIPGAMELHHRCEVPTCWNSDHLQIVTHAQNRAHTRKTHCKHGHPLAGANLDLAPGGLPKCRECNRAAQRAFQARHRAPRDR